MMRQAMIVCIAAMLSAGYAVAQTGAQTGEGQAVVTVLPRQHNELAPNISMQDLNIKVNGKESSVAGWAPFRAPDDRLELVILIQSPARNIGRQFDELGHFIQGLDPHTKAAIAYMDHGNATLAAPLSADHAQVAKELQLAVGSSTSPYFCLSDLAKNWPSQERGVRHEVLMVTDGVDPYNPRNDLDDTYVLAAVNDAVRAGLVVYSIYWNGRGDTDPSAGGAANAGLSLLSTVTQATGGTSYGVGMSNPVSFQPYLDDLALRLENQYRLSFSARLDRKPAVENLSLKLSGFAAQVDAPGQVFVDHAGAAAE